MARYWHHILQEVLTRHEPLNRFLYTNLGEYQVNHVIVQSYVKKNKKGVKKPVKLYSLGEGYEGVALTRREAECMLLLLEGKTMPEAAELLALSHRTVEYYVKKVKAKLNCRTKDELIETVMASQFRENIDFEFA